MKNAPMVNLSSPIIKYAQQRANRSGKTFLLVENVIGGIDIVPEQQTGLDEFGDSRRAVGIVHPQSLEVRHATV